MKHSDATFVDIEVSKSKQNLSLFIKGNGTITPKEKRNQGQGLENMKLRAKNINAHLEVRFSDGFETVFRFVLDSYNDLIELLSLIFF